MNVYDDFKNIENDEFLIRLVEESDKYDLLEVYGDEANLVNFNSDNCTDNFYYPTIKIMENVIKFWKEALQNRWFLRLSIVDKKTNIVIGTIEECLRVSDDYFNNMCILRLDVRNDYEKKEKLENIINLITPYSADLVGAKSVFTKGHEYQSERIDALINCGYEKTCEFLIVNNKKFGDYYIKKE